ncbi:MAG: hypothetical protein WKF84_17775 [Pyrinomonadaceae bacterium]
MRTSTAAKLMGARQAGVMPGLFADQELSGFAIDSRAVEIGQLFFALSPEDYARHCFSSTTATDAHIFIPQALERGAVAAVGRLARVGGDDDLRDFRDRLLLVDDVIEALHAVWPAASCRLGERSDRHWRKRRQNNDEGSRGACA